MKKLLASIGNYHLHRRTCLVRLRPTWKFKITKKPENWLKILFKTLRIANIRRKQKCYCIKFSFPHNESSGDCGKFLNFKKRENIDVFSFFYTFINNCPFFNISLSSMRRVGEVIMPSTCKPTLTVPPILLLLPSARCTVPATFSSSRICPVIWAM